MPDPGKKAPVDEHTLLVLEFPRLLQAVAGLAQSGPGGALVRALIPSGRLDVVKRRLARLSQLRELCETAARPGLNGLGEIKPLLSRLAVEGAFLVPEELVVLSGFLGSVGQAAAFLGQATESMDELQRLGNRITPLPELKSRISKVVGPGGSVSSKASPELARLRKDLNRHRERVRANLSELVGRPEYSGLFSDQLVTQRADRFVVPVRTDAKGRLPGIIHDTSGSGATCFVEPLEAIEDNNRLSLLACREQEEIHRILAELSASLAGQLDALGENLEALAKLDCLLAQAEFCRRLDARPPELVSHGLVELRRARHPLLAWRELRGSRRAVPIEVNISQDEETLIISGANAGGKTATIKTVGLMCLMTMCGLHIPVDEHSRISFFDRIFCEVGDEQDLGKELSTFTAHAGRLAWILNNAGPGSLVLVDELGGGTDPGEGAALGMAVLERLQAKGAKVICTTHYHKLKAFAALTDGVQNASVAFDQKTGQPTYQIQYGTPGFSDALAVSRKLGFDPKVLDRAEEFLDQGERQTITLLRQAQKDRENASRELAKAHAMKLKAGEERKRANEALKKARTERAGALAEGKRRVREVAGRMEAKLLEIIGENQKAKDQGQKVKPGRVRQDFYQARREALAEVENVTLGSEKKERPAPLADSKVLRPGTRVKVHSLGQEGSLLEDPPQDAAGSVAVSVGVRGVRVVVPVAELEPIAGAKPPKQAQPPQRRVSVLADADDGLDLKVIGLTVDEALPLVDKALDKAILAGRNRIRVVHGVGTGRLRQAVRGYLTKHPYVVSTGQEPLNRGGSGVTVAELRN